MCSLVAIMHSMRALTYWCFARWRGSRCALCTKSVTPLVMVHLLVLWTRERLSAEKLVSHTFSNRSCPPDCLFQTNDTGYQQFERSDSNFVTTRSVYDSQETSNAELARVTSSSRIFLGSSSMSTARKLRATCSFSICEQSSSASNKATITHSILKLSKLAIWKFSARCNEILTPRS